MTSPQRMMEVFGERVTNERQLAEALHNAYRRGHISGSDMERAFQHYRREFEQSEYWQNPYAQVRGGMGVSEMSYTVSSYAFDAQAENERLARAKAKEKEREAKTLEDKKLKDLIAYYYKK